MYGRSLTGARAAVLEHHGEFLEAIPAHSSAAVLWEQFGEPYEEAQALLGQARCLVAVGRAHEAAALLAAARGIFFRLRARPCLAEVDRLFDVAMAASH